MGPSPGKWLAVHRADLTKKIQCNGCQLNVGLKCHQLFAADNIFKFGVSFEIPNKDLILI